MGNSPRILPRDYGYHINSCKRVLRNKVYQTLADKIPGYTIVDFDLKSCYTSILLGLYSGSLQALQL